MRRIWPLIMLLSILILNTGKPVYSQTEQVLFQPAIPLSTQEALRLENLVIEADLILTGTVMGIDSYWNAEATFIFTDISLSVENVIKGETSFQAITVVVKGGHVGDKILKIEGFPELSLNQKLQLFLKQQDENKYIITGWQNGIYVISGGRIDNDTSLSQFLAQVRQIMEKAGIPLSSRARDTGQEFSMAEISPAEEGTGLLESAPFIRSISPSSGSAGTNTQVIIYGEGFGSLQGTGKVTFFYKEGQPRIQATVNSWSDTRIVATIPTGTINGYGASASSGPVLVNTSSGQSNEYMYAVSFSYEGHKWSAFNPVVHYYLNPNIPGVVNMEAAVQAGAQTWNKVSGISFSFEYEGITGNTSAVRDGMNVIAGGNLGASGPVAVNYYWFDTSSNMLEFDITFNTYFSWSTSGEPGTYDIQSVVTHELGHAVGFRDLYGNTGEVNDTGKIMYGRISYGEIRRDLTPEDQQGIRWIYPANPAIDLGAGGFGTAAIGVNPVTNRIYAANSKSNNVTVIDGSTRQIISTIAVGNGPQGIAVNPITNRIYVASSYGSSISVIDGASNNIIAVINVGSMPYRMGVNPLTNRIYTANYGSNTVSVIDGEANSVTATLNTGSGPAGVGVNPVTNLIYVSNDISGNVSVFNGADNTLVKTVGVGSGPGGVAVNPSTNLIYVANYDSNSVSVINGVSGNVTATIGVGTGPRGICVNTVSNRIYVANYQGNSVSVIDGFSGSVTNTISTKKGPFGIGVNENTNLVYTASYQENAVAVIDGADNSLLTNLKTGSGPEAVDINPGNSRLYAACSGDNSLTVIDLATNAPVATVEVGDGPAAVAVDPNTNYIYVANTVSDSLSVIDGGSHAVISTITTGNRPSGVAVNSYTNQIYITNNGNASVSIVDRASLIVTNVIQVGSLPIGIAVNPLTNRIYVANNYDDTVSVINGASQSVEAVIPVGQWPYGVKVNPLTNRVYVTNDGGNSVSVIDGASNTVISTVKVGLSPRGIALDIGANRVYAANSGSGSISVIDGSSYLVVATYNVGKGPRSIASQAGTNRIYVTNYWADNLSILQDNTPTPGVATHLSFTTQPGLENAACVSLTRQPVVAVLDANGDIVGDSSSEVVLSLTSGTGASGAVLSGATTINAVNGSASFTGLSLNLAGSGYTLTASAGALTGAVSEAFNVVHQGDTNGDGMVNMGDVVKVERVILGLDPGTCGCDADVDGEINMGDVTKLERIILGLDPLVG